MGYLFVSDFGMSFFFQSVGKRADVIFALSNDTQVPEYLKTAIVAALSAPAPAFLDGAAVDVHGHAGSFKVEVRELAFAAPAPAAPVGYGDDGVGSSPAPSQHALDWAEGRVDALAGKPMPEGANASYRAGYDSVKL